MSGETEPVEWTEFAMDTVVTIEAYGGDAETGIADARENLLKLEKLWSVTDENSEIYKLNHSQGETESVSTQTSDLLTFARTMAEETEGAFNPAIYPLVRSWGFTTGDYRIPEAEEIQELLSDTDFRQIRISGQNVTLPEGMELDFGAIAKGDTGDKIADALKANGVASAIINLGGNVRLLGASPDGGNWRIGILSPYGEGNIGILEAQDVNIITSGGYERYFIGEDGKQYWHILNPADGYPAKSGVISATIVSKDGALCDALSTAAFVMGLERVEKYWKSRDDFEMILVTETNEIYVTEGLEQNFSLTPMSQEVALHMIKR